MEAQDGESTSEASAPPASERSQSSRKFPLRSFELELYPCIKRIKCIIKIISTKFYHNSQMQINRQIEIRKREQFLFYSKWGICKSGGRDNYSKPSICHLPTSVSIFVVH